MYRLFLPVLLLVACSPGGMSVLRAPTATAHGREWMAASDSALRAPLRAELPARETGVYRREEARAVAWRFALRDGQRVEARVEAEGLPAALFVDLYEVTGDTAAPFVHRSSAASPDSAPRVGDSVAARLWLRYDTPGDA